MSFIVTLLLGVAKNFLPGFLKGFVVDLIEPFLKHFNDKDARRHAEKIQDIKADMEEQKEITNRLRIESGWWVTALQRPYIFYPLATHFNLVILDTILASKYFFGIAVIQVPVLPEPYAYMQGAIILSYFVGRSFEKVGRLRAFAGQLTKS